MVHDGARARALFGVYRVGLENNCVCMCMHGGKKGFGERRMGKEEKRHISPNARDWREARREAFLRSLPWRSHILAPPPWNAQNAPYRFVVLTRDYFIPLLFFHFHYILYFGKLSLSLSLEISPSRPRPRPSPSYLRRSAFSRRDAREESCYEFAYGESRSREGTFARCKIGS